MSGPNLRPVFEGLKVVEFAHVIAGPLAGTLLADMGAEIVHVEEPAQGDPSRRMGPTKDGVYLWWKVAGRNKRSVTIDLRTERGQALAHKLVAWADVVITNYRVGTLERWNLDWETIHAINPRIVMLQVSGFGANTTERDVPGFGKVGEAMSGVVNLTGFIDGPPVHTGFSHADTVTGLMGAFAISAALTRRNDPDFRGEWIDLALFESLFRLIEWQVIVYDQLGSIPVRAGNQLAVAPGAVINTYPTADEKWLTVTSGTPRSVRNVAILLGLPEDEYATVEQQLERRDILDKGLSEWISRRTAEDCLSEMRQVGVVASRIYTVADIVQDEIYAQRGDIVSIEDPELGVVRMPGVVPKLTNHPGRVLRTAPALGADNELVFREYLGLSEDAYQELIATETIG